ncbi:MAG: hypothetical protein LC777_04990 [Actinobacteria bacterium]|nr:hypothetical protein [Actinomycetota bacterium]
MCHATPVDIEVAATPEETLSDLLDRSGRRNVPIRRSFLQVPGPSKQPGPLAAFVEGRRSIALDLWLLLHAGAASGPSWDVRQPAMSWARMLRMPQTVSSETTIGRNWTWLEQHKLVRTERKGRIRKVFLLMEDGSGRDFERATGHGRGYFKLPYEYFTQRWHLELKLPGKVTLLICLAQSPTFTLPTERAAGWYGVSADTLQRGLDELRDLGLLKVWSRAKKAPRTRYGYTMENHYALRGPFVRVPIEVTEASEMVTS